MRESDFSGGVKSGLGLFASREPVLDLWGDIWEPEILARSHSEGQEIVGADCAGQLHLADIYLANSQDGLFYGFVSYL